MEAGRPSVRYCCLAVVHKEMNTFQAQTRPTRDAAPRLARILVLLASVGASQPLFAQASLAPDGGGGTPPASGSEALTHAPDVETAYEGRPVRAVLIREPGAAPGELTPVSGVISQRVMNNIRSYAGGAYRAETVHSDVARLNRLNMFKSVTTLVQLYDDGSVDLIFVVEDQPIVQSVQATGNRKLTDQQIALEVDVLVGTPVDRFQIDRAARRIENMYRERGYALAEVTIDEDALSEQGIVIFRIREGQRVKITDIRFDGAFSFEPRELRREVQAHRAGVFRKGAIDDDALDADVASLIKFYRDRGYLDVRADRILTPSPNGKEAILTFVIEEGPLYTLRDLRVDFLGEDEPGFEPVYSRQQILGLLSISEGDVYGLRDIDGAVEGIKTAYGQLGYADVSVRRAELRDPTRPLVDLVLRISPGQKYLTGQVLIKGNDLTKSKIPRRVIELRPERPLDTTKIDLSERRLRELRLFNPRRLKTTIQDPDPADPRYRDVLVEIEETNTGSFDLGGAVNSDAGLVGRIALTQRNFDITDTPDSVGEFFAGRAFRGAGQRFVIEAQPGDRVETYSISLGEPHLFETDYSGSAQLYFRDRDYDEFDERRFGTRLQFGRRLGTRWSGAINFRAEQVELTNIQPFRPTDIFDVADDNLITGIGPSLRRSSIDSIFLPTRGSVTDLSGEQVFGDFNFTRLNLEHTTFIPIREDFLGRATVISLRGQVGYIPQGREDVPTFERFYLGGQSFRGFDFRAVSPKGIRNDNGLPSDDPVGGNWLFFAGAEIRQPVFEDVLAVVGFVDSGTVTFDPGFDEYRVSVGVGIRLSIPQLSPAPLAFDFGFPVVKEDNDEKRVFTFSIDLPF